MNARVPVETKRAILEALEAGDRPTTVARRFGVHMSYPRKLQERGINERGAVLTPEQRQEIAALVRSGRPAKVMAYDFKVSPQHCKRLAREYANV
jgi:transposase-like protein